MYATNLHDFGHLVNQEEFKISRTRPDMYEIKNNFQVSLILTINFLI
jgi:hypothetical protein